MKVGVPTEIKTDEYRVALTPIGARELAEHGHDVIVQKGAGEGSAISDADYEAQGVTIVPSAEDVWGEAEMVLKVKEPQMPEVEMLRAETTLFTYLHLAPAPELTKGLCDTGAICIAYETVEDSQGRLPLLAPMSEIAGKIATQAGAFMLEKPLGGRGVLLGGVPGVAAANVMIIGGGAVGMNAAFIAIGMEADVFVYDKSIDRLRELDVTFGGTCFDGLLIDALDRGAPARHRPRHRRRPRPRSAGASRDHARAPRLDEEERGPGGRRDRPGRLLRDLQADDPFRSDLRGRRDHPLLRGEHARRGADHLDLRADERDPAVHARARRRRRRRGGRAHPRPQAGYQRCEGQGHARSRSRGRGHGLHAVDEVLDFEMPKRLLDGASETRPGMPGADHRNEERNMGKYAVINPATGETEKDYPEISDRDLAGAMAAASDAHQNWALKTTVAERAALVKKVAELHGERREALAEIAVREMGKPMEQALGEVDFCVDIYGFYADNGEEILADESIELLAGEGTALIRRTSVGPLLGIMPWNFPYYQVARFAGPNLVVGNTILLKPAHQCPESAEAIQEIFDDAGFPEGAYHDHPRLERRRSRR